MSRRAILLIVLGVILLGAGGWWITRHFQKMPVKHYEPPEAAARHNHYLALERFMSRMGRKMTATGDIRRLARLKPGGVLIIDRHHRAVLNKKRLKAVFDWVGKGGYLIVVPEYSDEPDPVMSYLHVAWDDDDVEDESCDDCGVRKSAKSTAPRPASSPAAGSPHPASAPVPAPHPVASSLVATRSRPGSPLTAPPPATASGPAAASSPLAATSPASAPTTADTSPSSDNKDDTADTDAPETLAARIPGSAHALAIHMQYDGLKPGKIKPEWKVPLDRHSDWLVHYRYGLGNVTLIANLDHILSNDSIGDFDHAEFFWKLLRHFQPEGPVTLMTRLPVPDLFDWLADAAWTASISGAVLIALWLWSVVPRFGGTVPDVPPSRRELREHLNAIGRFVWRNEGLGRWLETARGAFRERLLMRHPAIAAMTPEQQAEALAQTTGLARQTILTALTATPRHAAEFTAMLRTLKHLKHNL